MMVLFYLVFVFFAVLAASLLLIKYLSRVSQFIAWRELSKRPRGFDTIQGLRISFNFTVFSLFLFGVILSWVWTRSLVPGIFLLLFCPFLFRSLVRYQEFRHTKALESSALAFFYVLQGMVQSGRSLPSALFDVVQYQSTLFCLKLRKHLGKYEEGRGMSRILIEFKNKTRLPSLGVYLASLEMAYRQGLAVGPLLEKIIPTLETEQHFQLKVEDLRRQMMFQAVLAFFIPWALVGALWFFNPELLFSLSKNGWGSWITVISSSFELMGIWFLWQITSFP